MVKRHKWINGILESYNHMFGSFEEAKNFANNSDADTAKVYDQNGQLMHEVQPNTQNTYA
jgi:hypothetical protein